MIAAPLTLYELLNGTGGAVPADTAGTPPGLVLAVVAVICFIILCIWPRPTRRRPQQLAPVDTQGLPLIAIGQLPQELREPAEAFRRRGVKFISAAELAQIYDECSRIAAHRTQLYAHQTELLKARTAHDLAVAAAKFVAALNTEERALLHMRIEARVRLEFEQQRTAGLEYDVNKYLDAPRRD